MQNKMKGVKKRLVRSEVAECTEQPPSDGNTFEEEGFVSVGEIPKGMTLDEALETRESRLEARERIINAKLESMTAEELTAEFKARLEKRIDLILLQDCDADPTRLGLPGYEKRYYVDIGVAKYSTHSYPHPSREFFYRGCLQQRSIGNGEGLL